MKNPENDAWERAYLAQSHDAALGRLYRGVVHNLNGEIQAMSMNSELLGMMIIRVQDALQLLLQEGIGREEGIRQVQELSDLISERLGILDKVRQTVGKIQGIMGRTGTLGSFKESLPVQGYSINSVVETEIQFLSADPFFKHKVQKELIFSDNLPDLKHFQVEIHQIVAILLQNVLEAVNESADKPRLLVETGLSGNLFQLAVQDSGAGIVPADMENIYKPFFTTKQGHEGLGLYLARKLAENCNGTLVCRSEPGCTRFTLEFPVIR